MKVKLINKYETVMMYLITIADIIQMIFRALRVMFEVLFLYTFAVVELIKDLFVILYPTLGPLIGMFLVIGYAGYMDIGGSLKEFFLSILWTLIAFTVLTLAYLYLKNRRE